MLLVVQLCAVKVITEEIDGVVISKKTPSRVCLLAVIIQVYITFIITCYIHQECEHVVIVMRVTTLNSMSRAYCLASLCNCSGHRFVIDSFISYYQYDRCDQDPESRQVEPTVNSAYNMCTILEENCLDCKVVVP